MSATSVAGLREVLTAVVAECEGFVEDAALIAPEELTDLHDRGAFSEYAQEVVDCAAAVDADAAPKMLARILAAMPASWWSK